MLNFLLTPVQRNFILHAVETHSDEIVEDLFGEESKPTEEEREEIRELGEF
jgi:hypothetical protein